MKIDTQWEQIRRHFNRAFRSSLHYAIASINADGSPHVTPIGSLLLLEDKKGIYFEYFPQQLPANLQKDQRVSVLAVNSGKWFWFLSLLQGQFRLPPAMRLSGRVGVKRKATPEELRLWRRRVSLAKGTPGYNLLWKEMDEVREITFDEFEPVQLGEMTAKLWKD